MARSVWTEEMIRSLGVRTDLVTACSIVYGCGRNKAWELYHSGRLGFPAIRVGRKVVVPVAPLLRLLGLEAEPATTAAAEGTGAPSPLPVPVRPAR